MKLKTELSELQAGVSIIIYYVSVMLASVAYDHLDIEGSDQSFKIGYFVILVGAGLIILWLQKHIFGVPIISDSSKLCASCLLFPVIYQPSSVHIQNDKFDSCRRVKLRLTLDLDDIPFSNLSERRVGWSYFRVFRGYFPFTSGPTELYLTRSAVRQIKRWMRSDGPEVKYVQLEFKIKIQYFGREAPMNERYFILSEWDIWQLKSCLNYSRENEYFIKNYHGLALRLTLDDLAEYHSCLKEKALDTFIKVLPRSIRNEEEEE